MPGNDIPDGLAHHVFAGEIIAALPQNPDEGL